MDFLGRTYGRVAVLDYLVLSRPFAWVLDLLEIEPSFWASRVPPELRRQRAIADADRARPGAKAQIDLATDPDLRRNRRGRW